ncbi:MAG TPA: hypothetical protein VK524_22695 [Polyangiaceae bacterium]|nr:hypothetical protein [Polyangiaceae bacterium]
MSSFSDGARGSLRSVLELANSNAAGLHRAITIEVPAGGYELVRCGADDVNTGGDLDALTDVPLTLSARGGEVVVRQACAGERVIDSHGEGLLTLRGLTLRGGSLATTDPREPAEGGALRAASDVNLEKVTIAGNSARGASGVRLADGSTLDGAPAHGGGSSLEVRCRPTTRT